MTFVTGIYNSDKTAMYASTNLLYSSMDALSFIPQDGYYYITVKSTSGTGDFSLMNITSNNYSNNEPNDSPFQANSYTDSINTTDTLDNSLDEDWSKLTVTEDGTYTLSISPVDSSASISSCSIYMLNGSTGEISQITSSSFSLQKGTYYFCVSGSMSPSNAAYKFSVINNNDLTVSKVVISNIAGSDCTKLNYEYGYFWRVKNSFTISGKAYNSKGNIVPNAYVIVGVAYNWNTGLTTWYRTAYAKTDSQGNFQLNLSNIPDAYGEYSAQVGSTVIYRHYFDVIPMYFYNRNGNTVSCSDQYLYHFSVSAYITGL